MTPATPPSADERAAWTAAQLLQLLERAARGRAAESLPGLPGAKHPEEEILIAL